MSVQLKIIATQGKRGTKGDRNRLGSGDSDCGQSHQIATTKPTAIAELKEADTIITGSVSFEESLMHCCHKNAAAPELKTNKHRNAGNCCGDWALQRRVRRQH